MGLVIQIILHMVLFTVQILSMIALCMLGTYNLYYFLECDRRYRLYSPNCMHFVIMAIAAVILIVVNILTPFITVDKSVYDLGKDETFISNPNTQELDKEDEIKPSDSMIGQKIDILPTEKTNQDDKDLEETEADKSNLSAEELDKLIEEKVNSILEEKSAR